MNPVTAFAHHWAAQFWSVSMQVAVFIALACATVGARRSMSTQWFRRPRRCCNRDGSRFWESAWLKAIQIWEGGFTA